MIGAQHGPQPCLRFLSCKIYITFSVAVGQILRTLSLIPVGSLGSYLYTMLDGDDKPLAISRFGYFLE